MSKVRMSVVTATVRPDGLATVGGCLAAQTFADFEWLIVAPDSMIGTIAKTVQFPPPSKGSGHS